MSTVKQTKAEPAVFSTRETDTLTVRGIVLGTSEGAGGRVVVDLDARIDRRLGPDALIAAVAARTDHSTDETTS